MEKIVDFTVELVKGLVKNPEFVKVKDFADEDGSSILEIIVHNDDMSTVIGKNGVTAKAIKTLIRAAAYKENVYKIKINIDSI